MAVFLQARSAGVTAADWGRAVPGVALRRQPAVRRRVLRQSCRSGRGECPAGARARPAERAFVTSPVETRHLARDHAPPGARRARRALDIRIVSSHQIGQHPLSRPQWAGFSLVRRATAVVRTDDERRQHMFTSAT
jgi:hypothetical protein